MLSQPETLRVALTPAVVELALRFDHTSVQTGQQVAFEARISLPAGLPPEQITTRHFALHHGYLEDRSS